MPDSFQIELTTRLKINKVGRELSYLAGFFLAIFFISLIPAQYMPREMAFLYIFFIIPRNFHYMLGVSLILVIIGEWLRGLRKVESAKLRVYIDKMTIESSTKSWDIPYETILKFKGTPNLVHHFSKLTYTLLLRDQSKIEIRTSKEIYNELTDHFPDKV